MPKSSVLTQLTDELSLSMRDKTIVSKILSDDFPLQSRYQYDPNTQEFSCKRGRSFYSYIEKKPESEFYALLKKDNLMSYLTESECIRFYILYRWVGNCTHQHHLGPELHATFVTLLQESVCQNEKINLDELIRKLQTNWSAAKIKLYTSLIHNTSHITSAVQKAHYYHQMARQAEQKHFYHDGSRHHIFQQYADAVARYEYELLMQELGEYLQPLLYYPETSETQNELCEYARHCFFIDKDTKELHYINTMGTVFKIPSHHLLTKTIDDIPSEKNRQVALTYQKTKREKAQIMVDKKQTQYGPAFLMDAQILKTLVPDNLPQDPVITLAEKTLKQTKNHFFSLQYTMSLFGHESIPAFQHRIAGLIEVKEMLQGATTSQIHVTHHRPNMAHYMGRGRNTYIFYEHPDDPKKAEFWHVDRAHDTPVLTQFPMNFEQAQRLYALFSGAQAEPLSSSSNEDQTWYELGKTLGVQDHKNKEDKIFSLPEKMAKKIPELLLSDMPIYQHLIADRNYFETSNEFINLLENTEITPENKHLINRCRSIHEHLELIAQDRLRAFPKSRGVVPPDKRQQIMKMMMDLVRDKNSSEAQHYFRTEHAVRLGEFDSDALDSYEPSSFLWDEKDQLLYLDEQKKPQQVEMTDSIRRKLQRIMQRSEPSEQKISAYDVYQLMTRPRLFYYYCGIPIGLDLRWFDYTYYIPIKFDRSKGLHTGTAQEMIHDIHAQKLSVYNLLVKLGEVLILLVVPLVLASFGLVIPYAPLIGHLATTIVEWVMLVWNIKYTFDYLHFTLLMNELVHPELNQLDKLLKDLNAEANKRPGLEQNIELDDLDTSDTALLLPQLR